MAAEYAKPIHSAILTVGLIQIASRVYVTVLAMAIHDVQALTPSEVMSALRISRSTLNRYVEQGILVARRLPSGHRRFLLADVEALLAREADWSPAP